MGRDDLKPMVVFFTNTFSTFSGLRTLNYLGMHCVGGSLVPRPHPRGEGLVTSS